MKPNAKQNKRHRPEGNTRNTKRNSVTSAKSKRKATVKPGLYTMIFFWLLGILLLAAVFMKVRHYVNVHW